MGRRGGLGLGPTTARAPTSTPGRLVQQHTHHLSPDLPQLLWRCTTIGPRLESGCAAGPSLPRDSQSPNPLTPASPISPQPGPAFPPLRGSASFPPIRVLTPIPQQASIAPSLAHPSPLHSFILLSRIPQVSAPKGTPLHPCLKPLIAPHCLEGLFNSFSWPSRHPVPAPAHLLYQLTALTPCLSQSC